MLRNTSWHYDDMWTALDMSQNIDLMIHVTHIKTQRRDSRFFSPEECLQSFSSGCSTNQRVVCSLTGRTQGHEGRKSFTAPRKAFCCERRYCWTFFISSELLSSVFWQLDSQRTLFREVLVRKSHCKSRIWSMRGTLHPLALIHEYCAKGSVLYAAAAVGQWHWSLLILCTNTSPAWKTVLRPAERLPASCVCVSSEHSRSLYLLLNKTQDGTAPLCSPPSAQ